MYIYIYREREREREKERKKERDDVYTRFNERDANKGIKEMQNKGNSSN